MSIEKLDRIAETIGLVHDALNFQVDFINFVPSTTKDIDTLIINYHYLYKALDNLNLLNQGLAKSLDNAYIEIDDLREILYKQEEQEKQV